MSCPFLIVVHIFLIPISSGELDVILWDLSPDGSFSLRTASNIVHWIRPRDEAFFCYLAATYLFVDILFSLEVMTQILDHR